MKRFTMRSVLCAALILVLLTAAAVAAVQTGVIDFLNLDKGAVSASTPVVTGMMDMLDVEVREAATDGRGIHLVVAYSAKDEDTAVLMKYDVNNAFFYDDYEAGSSAVFDRVTVGFEQPTQNKNGVYFRKPFTEEARQKKRALEVDSEYLIYVADDANVVTGINWLYESCGTLVIDYVVDLRFFADLVRDASGNLQLVQKEVGDELTLMLPIMVSEIVKDDSYEGSNEVEDEYKELTITIENNQSAITAYHLDQEPVSKDRYIIKDVLLQTTDMASYLDVHVYYPAGDSLYALMNDGLWFDVLDADGNVVNRLCKGYKEFQDDKGNYVFWIYLEKFDVGDTLTLIPYEEFQWTWGFQWDKDKIQNMRGKKMNRSH